MVRRSASSPRSRSGACVLLLHVIYQQLPANAQYSTKDQAMAQAWWCAPGGAHAAGSLCKRFALTDAIAQAEEPSDKQANVDKLKQAIQRGEIDAQGLDATNPERHQMMEAWCESSDEASSKAKAPICRRAAAHKEFVKRRDALVQFWCVQQGHANSAKCKQMEYGQKMYKTPSGAERKRLSAAFKEAEGASMQNVEEETKKMLQALCSSPTGKEPLFKTTCSRTHSELR